MVRLLRNRFSAWLEDPDEYAQRVLRECSSFPEGDLFPFTFPALAMAEPCNSEDPRAEIASGRLLELAVGRAAVHLRTIPAHLGSNSEHPHNAVFLGHLGIALGRHIAVFGRARFNFLELHSRIVSCLADGLRARQGRPLDSYPGACWPFDTLPALAALAVADQISGQPLHASLIGNHLDWIEGDGIDPRVGLPYSGIDVASGVGIAPPRGCDIALRTRFLAYMDPRLACENHWRLVRHFWVQRLGIGGFSESCDGSGVVGDMDSGPVLFGWGSAATAFGWMSARLAGDRYRAGLLGCQAVLACSAIGLALRLPWIKSKISSFLRQNGLTPARDCRTGFLFGDACLFLVVSSATTGGGVARG